MPPPLVIFTKTPQLRVRKHVLIVNLAVADLLVGLISLPMYVCVLEENTVILGLVYTAQDALIGTASICGLAALAIERAYATYFPFKHRTLRKTAYIIGITVTWIVGLNSAICAAFYSMWGNQYFFIMIAPTITSLILVTVAYTLIWFKMTCVTRVAHVAVHHGRDKKLTVTLLITTIVSLVAWIPFQVLSIYYGVCSECVPILYDLVLAFKIVQYGNSLANPIIYAMRMREYKNAIMRTCCRNSSIQTNLRVNNRHVGHQETAL